MTDVPQEPPGTRALGRGVAFALIAMVVLVPALVMWGLVRGAQRVSAGFGDQPGGTIAGRVLPPEAARAVGVVRLEHASRDAAEGGGATTIGIRDLAEVALAADGRFSFEAPPREGRYAVSAGGGLWQEGSVAVSLLDEEARAAARTIELVLEPGCVVEVRVRGPEGEEPPSGEVRYRGRAKDGGMFGLITQSASGSRELSNGRATIDALPPLTGELVVTLEGGTTHEVPLDLEPGTKTIELDAR